MYATTHLAQKIVRFDFKKIKPTFYKKDTIFKRENKMKRAIVFAHFDKNNTIEDFVIYYLKELKKLAHDIIFVSDSNISELELNKISNLTTKNIIGHHGEYDFGSYKKGYQYLKNNNLLNQFDELIFANDSCYAPLFPLDNMFKKMEENNCDFWGATMNLCTENHKEKEHVQSYFLVFKSQIFKNQIFDNFINSIQKENNKDLVIEKYEIGLSQYLKNNGFIGDCYSQISKTFDNTQIKGYRKLILEEKIPFLKRSIAQKKNINMAYPLFLKELIQKETSYDYNLIKQDLTYGTQKNSKLKEFLCISKEFVRIITKKKKYLNWNINKGE